MENRSLGNVNVLVWLAEPLLRAGVRATLRGAGGLNILESPQPSAEGKVHVVVTDWSSGLLFARRSACPGVPSVLPHSKILIISPHAREHAVASALRSGVHGLILASCTGEELVQAIKALAEGFPYVCPEVAQRMDLSSSWNQLTARERQVLDHLARGQCNKTIARHLGIAVGTVNTHVKAIMAKLEASSRTEAASIAAERGIVSIPEFRSRRAAWSRQSHERQRNRHVSLGALGPAEAVGRHDARPGE